MERESRAHVRTLLPAKACIHNGSRTIGGEVKDISKTGIFVTAARQLEINDVVDLTIYCILAPSILGSVKATVIRVTDVGMGLQFQNGLCEESEYGEFSAKVNTSAETPGSGEPSVSDS